MTVRPAPSILPPGLLAFRALYGSFAHGTNTPTSDEDWRGVYLLPNNALLGLDRAPQTFEWKHRTSVEEERVVTDPRPIEFVAWELGHFCRLLLKGNPNIVGMLYAPDDCIDRLTPIVSPLFESREMFLHAHTVTAYMGWVHREMRDIERLHKGNAKRLSHVPRLLWEIEGAALHRHIEVRPSGDRLDAIMAIKTGTMDYDDAVAFCGDLLMQVEAAIADLALPDPPRNWTEDYLLDTRETYGR